MKKMMIVAALLAASAAGCKKKGDCKTTIQGVVDRMMKQEGGDKMKDMPPEMKKQMDAMMSKMVDVMTKRCVDDKWSADVLKCLNDAKSEDELKKCDDKLTPEQKAAEKKAEAEAMGMGDMGGGDEAPKADGSAAPAPTPAPAGSAAPAPAEAPTEGAAPAAAAGGDLPADCQRYKDDVNKLDSCAKWPAAAREQTKKAFDTASTAWANLPPAAKDQVNASCKTAADAIEKQGKSLCGW